MEETLPIVVRDKDLIDAGIFASPSACTRARERNDFPPHVKPTSKNIFCHRDDVIEWVSARYYNSNNNQKAKISSKQGGGYRTEGKI